MKKRTRFNTIVITGPKIKKIAKILAVAAALSAAWGLIRLFSFAGQQLAFSDSFYKTVISSQLHTDEEGISLKTVINALLGFNPADPKSIIAQSSPIFSEEFMPSPSPEATPQPTPTPEPSVSPSASAEQQPAGEEKPIEETKVAGDMKISNLTDITVDPEALANESLCFSIENSSDPQILIMHTHTTESFTDSDTNTYITSDSDRNLDENKNITAVGNAMEEVFNSAGIATVHDKTVHDYPSYNGAYTRALATIRSNLEAYPSIKIVLDVHRDGIVRDDGTKVKVTADINGEKAAQCMFVIGSNAILTHDNWLENMKLACKIQRLANEMYPGLMRPIILREERFNQQVSTGSIIIEVGSNGNTLDEAIRGGRYIADVITKLLKNQ